MMLSKIEKTDILEIISEHSEMQSQQSCNDLILPATEENIARFNDIFQYGIKNGLWDSETVRPEIRNGKIYWYDFMYTAYLKARLKQDIIGESST